MKRYTVDVKEPGRNGAWKHVTTKNHIRGAMSAAQEHMQRENAASARINLGGRSIHLGRATA